ncbi:hypothetical protein SEA_COLUCCI_61 [Arthrobacter phage Colucci]|uniref:Uncharacterized protein n=1 Tax=Arthrobacter phage Colucci TaxID=2015834 RepID=A0A286N2X3_9CAUD|nr:hypothetical protein FDI27_gp061 [Arthrobacter phage Colucci]ASX98730.1 hypothetical protein SEA_COLUCCI_61 [Arthrobacter phage Colucci]
MTADLTALDAIRERTRSWAAGKLRTARIVKSPQTGRFAVLNGVTPEGIELNMVMVNHDPGGTKTPVFEVEKAEAIVAAARDAKALMTLVDTLRTQFKHEAEQLRITADRLTQDSLHPPIDRDKAGRQEARETAERYRNFSSWADSVAYKMDKTIDDVLNPKEDRPNE